MDFAGNSVCDSVGLRRVSRVSGPIRSEDQTSHGVKSFMNTKGRLAGNSQMLRSGQRYLRFTDFGWNIALSAIDQGLKYHRHIRPYHSGNALERLNRIPGHRFMVAG